MAVRLEAQALGYAVQRRAILQDVSLTLSPGQFTALLGGNGAGKTTLLRLLLGLLRPRTGRVLLDGMALARPSRRQIARAIAYVPQAHVPAFPYSVREIVALGRTPARGPGVRLAAADEAIVLQALTRLGMQDFAARNYASLSGGERQAVLLARALAQEARILILDEPAAALDPGQQVRLMSLLSRLAQEGYAILAALHQPEQALRWCNQAVLLQSGRVLAQGAAQAAITAETLSTLYGIEVELLDGGLRYNAAALPLSC